MNIQSLLQGSSVSLSNLTGQGYKGVAAELNQQMGTNSVVFDKGHPMYSSYEAIQVHFNDDSKNGFIKDLQRNIGIVIDDVVPMAPILCEEDLTAIPDNLWIPILTMPEVRPLFEERKLYGWGLDPDVLPEEDVAGRLAQKNGRVEFTPDDDVETIPEDFEWTWKEGDPIYTIDELDAIDLTRGYVCSWLKRELDTDEPRDFTDDMSVMKP